MNWISVPRPPYSAGQLGSWRRRNTIFQELPIEEQGRALVSDVSTGRGVSMTALRIYGVFVWPLRTDRYPRLSTSILEDMNTSNWQILSDSPTLPEPLTTVSVRRQECERERLRRRGNKGGETVRGPTTPPDNSGIRDREWSLSEDGADVY